MKEKNYLEQPGADCPLWSSAVVGQLCRGRGISPLQLPQPGVSARPGDEEGTGFSSGTSKVRRERMCFRCSNTMNWRKDANC